MPRKKRTSTTKNTPVKNMTDTSISRSRSRSTNVKKVSIKSPAKARKSSKSTTRSKQTTPRKSRVSSKPKVTSLREHKEEPIIIPSTPAKKRKTQSRMNTSAKKVPIKQEKEISEVVKGTASATKPRRGRPPGTNSRSKSALKKSIPIKVKEEMPPKPVGRPRKTTTKAPIEIEDSESSYSDLEQPLKTSRTPSKPKRVIKEPKSRSKPIKVKEEPKKAPTRGKVVACKVEEVPEKGKKRVQGKTQTKVERKTKKKEEGQELPKFPTQDTFVEDLILDAIKGLKTKALEERIVGYLERRFSEVDEDVIKNVLERMCFEEKLALKKKGPIIKDKRSPLKTEPDLLVESQKRKQPSRTPSPPAQRQVGRPRKIVKKEEAIVEEEEKEKMIFPEEKQDFNQHNVQEDLMPQEEGANTTMEEETPSKPKVKNEEGEENNPMQQENDQGITTKEEVTKTPRGHGEDQLEEGKLRTEEEEEKLERQRREREREMEVKISESHSKRNLIEYYEKRPENNQEVGPQENADKKPTEGQTAEGDIAKKEEPEETKRQEVSRFEVNNDNKEAETNINQQEQIPPVYNNENIPAEGSQENQQIAEQKEPISQDDQKVEEAERAMVVWETQPQRGGIEEEGEDKVENKEAEKEDRIQLLMKLLTLPRETPNGKEGAENAQRSQEEAQRGEILDKVEEGEEERKESGAAEAPQQIQQEVQNPPAQVAQETQEAQEAQVEENITKTEPKQEEGQQRIQEMLPFLMGSPNPEVIKEVAKEKIRSTVDSCIEMLRERIAFKDTLSSEQKTDEGINEDDKSPERDADKPNIITVETEGSRRIDDDLIKEELEGDISGKFSVSKFFV